MVESQKVETSVESLRKTTATGARLVRPLEVEAEIAYALAVDSTELRRRAEREPADGAAWSNECLVHLIRAELRDGSRRDHLDFLLPALLQRVAASLRRALYGLQGLALDDVTQQVLDGLVDRLIDPGDRADFFEVRFALALKRLRIEVCRRSRPACHSLDDEPAAATVREILVSGPWPRAANDPERPAIVRQLITRLPQVEREVWILRHVLGYSINGRRDGETTIVERLEVSERTVRNRLRRAEGRLAALAGPVRAREKATA